MPSTPRTRSTRHLAASLIGLLVVAGCAAAMQAGNDGKANDAAYTLNNQGELVRPRDYRTWVYVGTPVTPNDMNNGAAAFPEHHNVYIDPASYRHYTRTGEWREGTTLVKELVSVGTKQAVSGNGYFQGEFIGLEATIKSSEDFPDEPGNWAYFSFSNKDNPSGPLAASAAAFPAASCNACHAASAQDDFVFTQHYPVLRAAKNAGAAPENRADRPKTLSSAAPIEYDQSGRDRQWQATQPTPAAVAGADVPTRQQELFDYLASFKYRAWDTAEPAVHPSAGPHADYGRPVRVFMNDTLAASLASGAKEHPVGAAAVKEMYTPGEELMGWAVEMKTQASSDGGDGWFWYEITSTTDGSDPIAIGNGVAGCFGCHSARGIDYVRTPLPQ